MSSKILTGIDSTNLGKMLKLHNISYDAEAKASSLLKTVNKQIEELGIRELTTTLKANTLKEIVEALEIGLGESNGASKVVMATRIKEAMIQQGLKEFLSQEEISDKALLEMVQKLGGASTSKSSSEEMIKEIEHLVHMAGFEIFLSRFEVPFLQEICSDLKLKCSTSSKNEIILAIYHHRNAEAAPAVPQRKVVVSKTKPELEEGISYDDLFNWFTVAELVEFCRDNEIKVSGTKNQLIERILSFFQGDKENIMSGTVTKTKRKKSEETKKREKKEKERQKKIENGELVEKPKKAKQSEEKEAIKSKGEEKSKSSKAAKSDDETEDKSKKSKGSKEKAPEPVEEKVEEEKSVKKSKSSPKEEKTTKKSTKKDE